MILELWQNYIFALRSFCFYRESVLLIDPLKSNRTDVNFRDYCGFRTPNNFKATMGYPVLFKCAKEGMLSLQVSAEDGEVFGEYVILDDFIHLSHANGVYLLDDRLCILAVRLQNLSLAASLSL